MISDKYMLLVRHKTNFIYQKNARIPFCHYNINIQKTCDFPFF